MKTRIQFEPSDFLIGGQMIIRESCSPKCQDIGFMCSVSYKIGWRHNSGKNIILKISLSDGMCIEYASDEELCEKLNSDPHGYRPMSQEEINAVMNYCGNRFKG